jgi:hypothetical protein
VQEYWIAPQNPDGEVKYLEQFHLFRIFINEKFKKIYISQFLILVHC